MTTPLLDLRKVRKAFDGNVVLRDVDLAVEPHRVAVLIGASGSGKSTLLRCVNLLETVDDGVILLDGGYYLWRVDSEGRHAAERLGAAGTRRCISGQRSFP